MYSNIEYHMFGRKEIVENPYLLNAPNGINWDYKTPHLDSKTGKVVYYSLETGGEVVARYYPLNQIVVIEGKMNEMAKNKQIVMGALKK